MLARQPFRIDGNKAYGLAIADGKPGVATMPHDVKALQAVKLIEYGTQTVLINSDEEIGSPGSRAATMQADCEHNAVLSFEGSGTDKDHLSLATSGIASVEMKVEGRASHAGGASDCGVKCAV